MIAEPSARTSTREAKDDGLDEIADTSKLTSTVDYFLGGRPAAARVFASDYKWRQGKHALEWTHPETGRTILYLTTVDDLEKVPVESTLYVALMAEELVATPEGKRKIRKHLGDFRRSGGRIEYVG